MFERHPMGSCVFKRWDCAALVHESDLDFSATCGHLFSAVTLRHPLRGFLDRELDGTLCAFDFGWFDFHRPEVSPKLQFPACSMPHKDACRAGFREHQYVHFSPWSGQTWHASGARWSINLLLGGGRNVALSKQDSFETEVRAGGFRSAWSGDLMGNMTQLQTLGFLRREVMPRVCFRKDWSRVHGPGDDEEEFGGNHAERTGGHACAVGRSLAVHFSYAPLPGRR